LLLSTHLRRACHILLVLRLMRDLVEHRLEQHAQARVRLDGVLEVLQDRVQLLWVFLDMFHRLLHPFLVRVVRLRQPCTLSADWCSVYYAERFKI
jgi:hypothetical protein